MARRLGSVPWYRDGCNGLAVVALSEVPSSDDSMIRAALVRGALSCRQVDEFDRVLNRELWQIGYVARIERNPANRAIVSVEISRDR